MCVIKFFFTYIIQPDQNIGPTQGHWLSYKPQYRHNGAYQERNPCQMGENPLRQGHPRTVAKAALIFLAFPREA